MGTGFVEFRLLREVGVFSYSVYFRFKNLVNGLNGVRPFGYSQKLGLHAGNFWDPFWTVPDLSRAENGPRVVHMCVKLWSWVL